MYLFVASVFLTYLFLLSFDEFKFHRKRGVSKKERWNQVLDMFVLCVCSGLVAFAEYDSQTKIPFGIAALFSFLGITKNEFAYSHQCANQERWIHSMIYMTHPIMLLTLCVLWPFINGVSFFIGMVIPFSTHNLKAVGIGYFVLVCLMTLFQFAKSIFSNFQAEQPLQPEAKVP